MNYDAQIPDQMRLHMDEPTKEMPKEDDKKMRKVMKPSSIIPVSSNSLI